jgi:hypothetical protein
MMIALKHMEGHLVLEAPLQFVDFDNSRTLVREIELFRKNMILVVKAMRVSLGIDDV